MYENCPLDTEGGTNYKGRTWQLPDEGVILTKAWGEQNIRQKSMKVGRIPPMEHMVNISSSGTVLTRMHCKLSVHSFSGLQPGWCSQEVALWSGNKDTAGGKPRESDLGLPQLSFITIPKKTLINKMATEWVKVNGEPVWSLFSIGVRGAGCRAGGGRAAIHTITDHVAFSAATPCDP